MENINLLNYTQKILIYKLNIWIYFTTITSHLQGFFIFIFFIF